MPGPRISTGVGTEGNGKRVNGGSEEHKAIGAFVVVGPMLFGGLHVGRNCVRRTELVWMVLEVVHWGRSH